MKEEPKINIKKADVNDTSTIVMFIKYLAEYEKLTHQVSVTEELLKQTLFRSNTNAFVLIASYNNKPVGFALYFFNFSTFIGKPGLYLEDLFVLPEMRAKGIGKLLLIELAKIAKENNCGRFEWSVLDWNTPAINFYKKLGAMPMEEWTIFRMDEEKFTKLANNNE